MTAQGGWTATARQTHDHYEAAIARVRLMLAQPEPLDGPRFLTGAELAEALYGDLPKETGE